MNAGNPTIINTGHDAPLMADRPIGAEHYRLIGLCFLAWIFDFYDLILYSFLLVSIGRDLHLDPAASSLALGSSFLMTAVGGVIFGFIGDRFGRRPVVIASVVIYGVGTLLCATSHSLTELIVFRSLTGLGIGGEWAAGQSLIAEGMPSERRARYAAYVQVGAPLGVLLAAVAGGFLEPRIGWRMVFALSAIPAVVVALAAWRWLSESDVWIRDGRQSVRTGLGRTDFGALWKHRHVLAMLFIVILVNSEAYWFTYSWMPGYLQLKRGLTDQASGRLMIGMQIGAIAGYGVFGLLADRFGRRPVFSIFAALMALGVIPPTLLWHWASETAGLIPAAMVVAGVGTGLWSGVPPIVSELLPTRVRNSALGLLLNLTRGLQFFTPMLVTSIGARAGFGPTLAIGALFSAIGSALIWTLPETRGRDITALDR